MTTNDMAAIMNPKENFHGKTYNEEKGNIYEKIYARAEAVARALHTQAVTDGTDGDTERKQNVSVTIRIPCGANILSGAVNANIAEMHTMADAVCYRANEDSVFITFTIANIWLEEPKNEPTPL